MSPVQDGGFDRIGLPAYKAASLAAQNLPEPVTSFAASMLGAGFGAGMRARRSMIERHLRRADPSLRGAAVSGGQPRPRSTTTPATGSRASACPG